MNAYEVATQEGSTLCLTKEDFKVFLRQLKEEGTKVISVRAICPLQGVVVPPPLEDEFEDFC